MGRTIKARYSKGVIEPLERINLREGEEVTINILETYPGPRKESFLEALKATAGGWKDLVDCEELKKNIYNDRLIATRTEVKL